MSNIFIWIFLAVVGLSLPAYAQTTQQNIQMDNQAIHKDEDMLKVQERDIHELDRQRNEALRLKNPALATKLQAQIDQKRSLMKNTEADVKKEQQNINQQKYTAEEQCEHDPVCAKKKHQEEVGKDLENHRKKLADDEAAAAQITQEKAEIEKLEAELRQ